MLTIQKNMKVIKLAYRVFLYSAFSVVILSFAAVLWAAESVNRQQEGVEQKAASPKQLQAIKPFRTGCYTDAPDCAGKAYFKNGEPRSVGCTVWANNGGRSNWVYGPGEEHALSVVSGDTYSCVYSEYAPPAPSIERYWIWVK